MKLTRSHKRYASILGVCLLALVVDQIFLSPGSASADETSAPTTPATPAAAAQATPEATEAASAVTRSTLTATFEWMATDRSLDPLAIDDVFTPPASWLPASDVRSPASSMGEDAERFRQRHRVTAVMANGGQGYALVDGQRLRIGETLEGFRLMEVRPRSIVLTNEEGQTVTLELPKRKLTPAPRKPDKKTDEDKKTKKDESENGEDKDKDDSKKAESGSDPKS